MRHSTRTRSSVGAPRALSVVALLTSILLLAQCAGAVEFLVSQRNQSALHRWNPAGGISLYHSEQCNDGDYNPAEGSQDGWIAEHFTDHFGYFTPGSGSGLVQSFTVPYAYPKHITVYNNLIIVMHRNNATIYRYNNSGVLQGQTSTGNGTGQGMCTDGTDLYASFWNGSSSYIIRYNSSFVSQQTYTNPSGMGGNTNVVDFAYDAGSGHFFGLAANYEQGTLTETNTVIEFTMGGSVLATYTLPFMSDGIGQFSLGLVIDSVTTAPTQVYPGQTGIAVSMDASNLSTSNAATINTAGLTFTGQADRTSEYTVTPDPGNPTSIAASGQATFNFTVDVSVSASEETITVDGTLDGTMGGGPVVVNGSQSPDTWDVVGARPEVRTVDAVPTVVGQGSTGNVVNFTVENVGFDDWTPGAITMSFMGAVDRTSEYTVTPAPGNPVLVAAGATESFAVLVDVSPAATIETITIDVAQIDGTDVVTGRTQGDSGADTPDTWDVVTCAATICGDCDGDTAITILDAFLAARHAAFLITLTGIDFTNCNVTGDLEPLPTAVVDVLDALLIAQAAAQLPVALNCC